MTKNIKERSPRTYSIPSLRRLPLYLRELRTLAKNGEEFIACPYLADVLSVDTVSVRKDLELSGVTGLPGVGYRVKELIDGIEHFLGWKNTSEVFLAGHGELAAALTGFSGFAEWGLRIIAAFQPDPVPPETFVNGVPVFGYSELPHLTARLKVNMAVLCAPDDEAGDVYNRLSAAGIRAVLNFTQHTITPEPGRLCRQVNPGSELAVLSIQLKHLLETETPE